MSQNAAKEAAEQQRFRALQDDIFRSFAAAEPATPVLRCRNATQTSVVLEWDPVRLATADLISLSLYRNGQKAGNIPRPLHMHSTKISGLAVDTEYAFYLVLRTSAGTRTSEKVTARTHKMTDLSGITITAGILPAAAWDGLAQAVERIGAKLVDGVRIDTTHFVTTEGRGAAWEKAVENNIPVVRPEWVEACESNGRILGVTRFYLDAMRGPLPQEPPAPPVPPKQESPREEQPAGEEQKADGGHGVGGKGDDAAVGDQLDHDDEPALEAEQTTKRSPADEQKTWVEEKEQKLALRPREEADEEGELTGAAAGANGWTKDDAAEEHEDKAASDRPAANTDGSSFQEVEL